MILVLKMRCISCIQKISESKKGLTETLQASLFGVMLGYFGTLYLCNYDELCIIYCILHTYSTYSSPIWILCPQKGSSPTIHGSLKELGSH